MCGTHNAKPTRAAILPIMFPGNTEACGVLIIGLNQLRIYEPLYQSFLNIVSSQVGITLSNGRAREEERKKAESLGKISEKFR